MFNNFMNLRWGPPGEEQHINYGNTPVGGGPAHPIDPNHPPRMGNRPGTWEYWVESLGRYKPSYAPPESYYAVPQAQLEAYWEPQQQQQEPQASRPQAQAQQPQQQPSAQKSVFMGSDPSVQRQMQQMQHQLSQQMQQQQGMPQMGGEELMLPLILRELSMRANQTPTSYIPVQPQRSIMEKILENFDPELFDPNNYHED